MAEAEKIRILIVDDIADTRDNLAKLIGFEPDMEVAGTADGGQAAVNMAKKERPHVILMDINMPDMDGITATELINAIRHVHELEKVKRARYAQAAPAAASAAGALAAAAPPRDTGKIITFF